jgi:hypothetical protein
MFANPTKPNLVDYLAFLSGSVLVGVPAGIFPSVVGLVTGGTLGSLLDTAQAWTVDQWQGYSIIDLTKNTRAVVASNGATSAIFVTAMPAAPVPGDQYAIAPGSALMTLDVAVATVNPAICAASAELYTLAVYNLATDRLFNYAQDVPGQTFFRDQRGKDKLNLSAFAPGVVASSGDEGSSTSLLNPEAMKRFTLRDLQMLKTPWGREYMGIAQMYGVNVWGLT